MTTARQQLATLATVFQRVSQSGLDLEPFAAEVVRGARLCTGAEVAAFAWVDTQRSELDVVWVGPGEPQREPLRLPLAEGIFGLVSRYGDAIRLEDAPQHPSFSRSLDLRCGSRTRGLLALPVKRDAAVAAVLQVTNAEAPFTDLEYDALAGLAALASFVLQTKHTFWTSRTLTGQATATMDILGVAPSVGMHGLLALAAQRLAALLHADCSRAWLVDRQTMELEKADGPDAGARSPMKGLAGQAGRTRQLANVMCTASEPLYDATVDCNGVGASLSVPVSVDGDIWAVLQVANVGPVKDGLGRPRFTSEDELVATALAACVARRLLEVHLSTQLEMEKSTTAVMGALATTMYTAATDQVVLLEMVRRHVEVLTHADKTLVYQYTADRRRFHLVLGADAEISVPAGSGLLGAVAKSREAVLVDDAYSDPRFDQTVDSMTQYHTQSVLCVPMLSKTDVVAVFGAVNRRGHGGQTLPFRPEDLQATVALCRFASAVWSSTTAFHSAQQKSREELIVDRIASELADTPLDPRAAYQLIGDRMHSLCPCENVAMLFLDAEMEELRGYCGEGPEVRLPCSAVYLPCEALRKKERIHLVDVSTSRTFDPISLGYDSGCAKVRSVLCLPFLHHDAVIAVAQLINRRDGAGRPVSFSPADLSILSAFVAAAAAGLNNIVALREMQGTTRQHSLFADLMAAIPADVVSGPTWLCGLREHLQALVCAQRCALLLVDFVTDTVACHNGEGSPVVSPLKSSHLLHHVVRTGEAVFIKDCKDDRRCRWAAEVATDSTALSLLYVPFACSGVIVGVAQLINRHGTEGQAVPFTRDDLRTITAAVRHAGPILQLAQHQARLARETSERAVLSENMSRVAASDLAEVANIMQATADVALTALRGEQCFVLAYERENRQLVSDPSMNTVRRSIVVDLESVPGEAVVQRRPLSLAQASEHQYFRKHDVLWGCRTRCLLVMPIYVHGAVVGAIMVLNKTDGSSHFTKEDAEKLTLFSSSCATAIGNCTQFRNLRRQLGQALAVLHAMNDLLPTHHVPQLLNFTEQVCRRQPAAVACLNGGP
eukprot:GGOE01065541.1.p1 GENE.GGOE01065541.1~~GGOE01065541.1.p1  ORF type:complete len:1222 (+),score=306.50 GGOE01065541.1:483-3668(+)